MRRTHGVQRLAVLAASGAILAAAVGAAPASATSGALGAVRVTAAIPAATRQGEPVRRAHLNATAAAAAAKGVVRPASSHRTLSITRPVTTARPGTVAPRQVVTSVSPKGAVFDAPWSISGWAGLDQSLDKVAASPPDPWIAVSGSYVIQSVNSLARVSDRAGNELLTIPMWALFGLDIDEHDADPRILWDAVHGRWVGVLMSYTSDGLGITAGYLNIAISDGADPRGSWQLLSYSYADDASNPTLPDYPGIASTSDSVVVTANEFDSTESVYLGASILSLRWSDLLAGNTATTAQWTLPDPDVYCIRPAITQGAATGAHLVASDAVTGDLLYFRMTTPATVPTGIGSWLDLSSTYSMPGLGVGSPTPPRQPGPDTIERAVDERITDAVWRANRLVFVSTYNGGSGDTVRLTGLNTSVAPASVTGDMTLTDDLASDAYMGGIGFTANGSLVAAWSQSGPDTYIRTIVAQLNADTFAASGSARLWGNGGDYAYSTSERWGDYLGVATDPLAKDTVWVGDEGVNSDGTWTTTVHHLTVDVTAPTLSAPSQSLVAGTTLGSLLVPVKVSWTAGDTGSGLSGTWLSVNQFGTGLTSLATVAGPSLTVSEYWKTAGTVGDYSYQYGLDAMDNSYNSNGTTVSGPVVTPTVYQQTSATYTGTWATSTLTDRYSGNTLKSSTSVGASASLRTTGRSFAVIATKGATYGKAKIYVDGVLKSTVTLTAASTRYRNLVFAVNFPSSGTHTIKVVVASGRVNVDAFLVLK